MKVKIVEDMGNPCLRLCVLEFENGEPCSNSDLVGRVVRLDAGLAGKIERVGDWDDLNSGQRVVVRVADDRFATADINKISAEVILGGAPTPTPKGVISAAAARIAACEHGHPEFYKLLADIAELHSRKNHDYAGKQGPLANLTACKRMGIEPFTGVMIRLQDKAARLENFMAQGELQVKGEAIEDTLMDQAVYSLLAVVLRREAGKQ